MHINYR